MAAIRAMRQLTGTENTVRQTKLNLHIEILMPGLDYKIQLLHHYRKSFHGAAECMEFYYLIFISLSSPRVREV
jgi:hypothetical protein